MDEINQVGQMAEYLNKFGPTVVILAVFLVLFLIIILYFIKANKKSAEDSTKMTHRLIESMLNDYEAKNAKILAMGRKNYDEKNIVDIFVKLNKSLKNACESTCKKVNSDRTAIYVFHNGSHASHGLPFFKMSCISEWVSKTSNSNIKMADHSAMPLNLFDSIVSGLYDNSEYRITEGKNTDPGDLIFLKNTKIKDCIFVPIYDDENNMMGFVLNGYNTINENINLDYEKECLIDLANMARPVIEFSKCQDYKSSNEKE